MVKMQSISLFERLLIILLKKTEPTLHVDLFRAFMEGAGDLFQQGVFIGGVLQFVTHFISHISCWK